MSHLQRRRKEKRGRGLTVRQRVMWMTRKSGFIFDIVKSSYMNTWRYTPHIYLYQCLHIKVVMYLSKSAFTVIFCVVLCVPTHTVKECDIFCILVLIWAEELHARTKQMGTKAFHLWALSLYERQWPGCQPLKWLSWNCWCISWEMNYLCSVVTCDRFEALR